jgi:predicted lipoprotein with Yx(FWY)xxD motif
MKTLLKTCLLTAGLMLAASAAFAAGPPAPQGASLSGSPAEGRPLYTYDKDPSGSSACNGPCLASWPPLMADGGGKAPGGAWSVIDRPEGGKQWTYKGKPVYGFFRDTPGAPAGGDNKVPGWRLLK